jgi:hypothetical protein
VIGQNQGTVSTYDIDVIKETETLIQEANTRNIKVLFKPHPLSQNSNEWPQGFYAVTTESLDNLLNSGIIRGVAGFTSNCLVESIIRGVPIFCYHKACLAYDVANYSLEDFWYPKIKRREEWYHDLMFTQWHTKEMITGECWQYIRDKI